MATEDPPIDSNESKTDADYESSTAKNSPMEELRRRRIEAQHGGGETRIKAQHERGKLTARERTDYFLDDDTFYELGQFVEHHSTNFDMEKKRFAGDGVVTGYGEVDGRTVFVFAHDLAVSQSPLDFASGSLDCEVTAHGCFG